MRKHVLFAGLSLAAVGSVRGATIIGYQGFEPGDSWTLTTGASNISSLTGATDSPANQRIIYGANSWQVSNGIASFDLAPLSLAGYTSCYINFRVTSTSRTGSNGADAADYVRAFVSLNGDSFALNDSAISPEISLTGNNNARWGGNASLVGLVNAGSNIQRQAPQGGTNTYNYDDFTIFIPKGTSTVSLRIVAMNDDADELWNIDNISLGGTLIPPATWDANGSAAGTGGTGTWDLTNARFNDGALTWSNTVNGPETPVTFAGTAGVVSLGTGISANSLTFAVSGYQIASNTLTLTGATATANVATTGHVATISSQLTGSAGLNKTGAGKLVLTSATNNYTGATTVAAGQLTVNGTHSGAGNYTVASGATLAGTGSINLAIGKSLTVSAGATLTPGDSTGRMTVSGDVILGAPSATIEIAIDGDNSTSNNYSQLRITGSGSDLGLNGASLVIIEPDSMARLVDATITSLDTFDPINAYKIIDVAGGASYASAGNLFGSLNGQPGSTVFNDGQLSYRVFYFDNDGVYVQFGSVPEPGSALAMLLAGGALLRRRGRC